MPGDISRLLMSTQTINSKTRDANNPLWLALFAASGAASLTYQVVWQRVLTQEVGIDSVSVTLIVAIFMLGLGFGSLAGARLASRPERIAIALGLLELAIGVFGFFSVDLIRMLNRDLLVGSELAGQLCANFALLLLPTLAMGATTPLMVEMYRDDVGRGRSVGTAYAANIAGAALGVLLCGFLLIGTWGLLTTSRMVALLDVAVAVMFFWSRNRIGILPSAASKPSRQGDVSRSILVGAFLIGIAVLGNEVVYFRLFTTYFGVSPYVFPMLLFAYLANMALGTWLGGWASDRWALSRTLSIGVCATAILSLPILWLPQLLLYFGQAQLSLVFNPSKTLAEHNLALLGKSLVLSLVLLLPVAASSSLLPAIIASIQTKASKGALFGRLYFAQTIGNTAGCLLTGFGLYHFLDSPRVLAVLAVALTAGVGLIYFTAVQNRRGFAAAALTTAAAVALFNYNYLASVHYFRTATVSVSPVWVRDTLHGMTLVYDRFGDKSAYMAMAAGRFGITSIPGNAGWVPTPGGGNTVSLVSAIKQDIKTILFIGLGTGEELLLLRRAFPDAKVTVVEINPDLIDAFMELGNDAIVRELKSSHVVLTDGRRYLQTHAGEKFDYIHIGVHRASTSGTGNLFSKELLRELKSHLTPGGAVTFYAYPPVVKAALDVFGDVAVFTRNGSIGITYCTVEQSHIVREGFLDRYNAASAKAGGNFEANEGPPWLDGAAIFYPKPALTGLLSGMPPATDDHLVTEYYLNARTELIPGLHNGQAPTDYRVWPYSAGAQPFPGKGELAGKWDRPTREVSWVGGQVATALKSGSTTPSFQARQTGSVVSLDKVRGVSAQWNFPEFIPVNASKQTFIQFEGTCNKSGRGIWGIKAYFTGKDGLKVSTIHSAARGTTRLPLALAVPSGVNVNFALTFDNAPGLGNSAVIDCSEFKVREY